MPPHKTLSKNKSANLRVALYARVSTDMQDGEDHHSLDAQLREMNEYAQHEGWRVVGEFIETASGTVREREQLGALLDLAQHQGCDVVLVHELSRLSRSVYHTLDIFDLLGQHGVGFASVRDPNFDFADPSKRFFLILMAALNQYYVDMLRMHTSKAKRERQKKGLHNASIMPYGYRSSGDPQKPAVIEPSEAVGVRLAYELYASGNYTDQEVAQQLTTRGFRPRARVSRVGREGQPSQRGFSKATVAAMLTNPFYIGKVGYRDFTEEGPGQQAALIETELWDKCRAVRVNRRAASRAAQKPYRVYLLSHLVCCDVCGRRLRSQASATGSTYYREMSLERGFTDCPHHGRGVRADKVERQLHALMAGVQLPADWLAEAAAAIGDNDDLEVARRNRASLEATRRRIRDNYTWGFYSDDPDAYRRDMQQVQQQLDRLPTLSELETLGSALAAMEDLPQVWARAEPADQRDLLRLMLREVQLDVATGRIRAFAPQAVFIPVFRQVPLLEERGFGVFVPRWPAATAADVMPDLVQATTQAMPSVGYALPFLTERLPPVDAKTRNLPEISHALALCRQSGQVPEVLAQVVAPTQLRLPVDLRKWPTAVAETVSQAELLGRPPESVDVLVSEQLFFAGGGEAPVNDFAKVLTPGGVWYLAELLPGDMPAHWVYHFFPGAWEHARRRGLDLHRLFTQIQASGLRCETQRRVFYQPVAVGLAAQLAEQRPGILAELKDTAYAIGLEKLRAAVAEQGADSGWPSEVALVEMWAQKPGPNNGPAG